MLDKIIYETLRVIENDSEDFHNFSSFEWADPLDKQTIKEKLMASRHHASHPPSKVLHNPAVNRKPNYVPPTAPFAPSAGSPLPGAVHHAMPEEAANPNNNPSQGPVVSTDGANASLGKLSDLIS